MSASDYKYAHMLSTRLDLFKIKKTDPLLINFRDPLCGDSETNKFRARGYIYVREGQYRFHCHNCGRDWKFGWFLKNVAPDLHAEWRMEMFTDSPPIREQCSIVDGAKPKALERHDGALASLRRLSQLPVGHPARAYADSRQLPTETHHKVYFAPNFSKWINEVFPEKTGRVQKTDPRIVFPFCDRKGRLFALQGRSIDPDNELRYITVRIDEDTPKIYGLDHVDVNRRMYIFEGPIDSLFVTNSLAMAGADVTIDQVVEATGADPRHFVMVYDNEPRAVDICRRMEADIDAGHKIVIWPSSVRLKDINAMVLGDAGHGIDPIDPKVLRTILDDNTYHGMAASLKFAAWRRDSQQTRPVAAGPKRIDDRILKL